MAFTCPAKTSLTDADIITTYGDGVKVRGILPDTQSGDSERNQNGMLKDSIVAARIKTLTDLGIVPAVNTANTAAYIKQKNKLLVDIQSEYCYYDSRYKYTLQKLFDAVNQGYLQPEDKAINGPNGTIKVYLGYSQMLNKKLNDLTQIINGVTQNMIESIDDLENSIAQFNDQIQALRQKLDTQNQIITSSEATIKIRKEMIKYTEEKARYSDNLLKLYSFMNVIAVGLLVYVYKAAN